MRALFRFIFLFITLYTYVLPATAQDKKEEPVIDIKQRFLRPKRAFEEDLKQTVDSNSTLRLMIAGNIYQTEKHANYCFDEATGRYNFREELKYIQPILGLGDVTIANLKTAFANDVRNMFCAPDEFALALKYSGINVLTHANLHTANIDKNTLKRTRDMLYEFEMLHTGAFTDNMQRNGNYPLIIQKKGFKIALLNYGSLGTRPSVSRDFIINEIDKTFIERDMRMARAYRPDFTIVYFDWGANMQDIPSYQQMDLAQWCFQQGANMVVGTHPNTPMRLDYMPYMSNGVMREGIVAYSLGNLIASNDEVRNRNGYVMDVELIRNNFTGETKLGDWGVIPVYTHYDTSSVKGKTRVLTVPCAAVESGDIMPGLPYIEKRRVINGAYEVRKLLGSTADEIQYNLTELAANNVMETIDLTNAALNNKYNKKRESDIAPSPAPVLPVARAGSNNPPSLALIYDEQPKATDAKSSSAAANKKPNAIDKERSKADAVFAENAPNILALPAVNSVQEKPSTAVNPPSATSGTTAVAAANKTADTTVAVVAKTETAVLKGTAAPVAEKQTDTKTTVAANAAEVKNDSGKTAAPEIAESKQDKTAGTSTTKEIPSAQDSSSTATTIRQNAYKNTDNTIADTREKNQTTAAPVTAANESAKKATTTSTSAYKETTHTTANTNYHTTGKDYQLPEKNYAERKNVNTTVQAPEKAEPIKAEAASQKPALLPNSSEPVLATDIKKVKERELKLVTDTFYRIQFYALQRFIPLDTNYYTHLKGYEVVQEDSLYKYMLGRFKTFAECENYWKTQILPRYKQSFIVKYIDGKRILK